MKKQATFFITTFALVLTTFMPIAGSPPDNISVTINGQYVDFPDAQPIILNDRAYVPLRFVAENIGAEVEWNPADRSATVTKGNITLILTIGDKVFFRYVNGMFSTDIEMDVPPIILDGRTMLPIRFVVEEFGYSVDWEQGTQTVIINPMLSEEPETYITNTAAAFELEVFRLTNLEREKVGLSPISWDNSLAAAARKHCTDMITNNYFSHDSLDGSSVRERANREGWSTTYVGENIAHGQRTPEAVVQSWMNSPGHKENILRKEYTHIGVGFDGYYWAQVFGGR